MRRTTLLWRQVFIQWLSEGQCFAFIASAFYRSSDSVGTFGIISTCGSGHMQVAAPASMTPYTDATPWPLPFQDTRTAETSVWPWTSIMGRQHYDITDPGLAVGAGLTTTEAVPRRKSFSSIQLLMTFIWPLEPMQVSMGGLSVVPNDSHTAAIHIFTPFTHHVRTAAASSRE